MLPACHRIWRQIASRTHRRTRRLHTWFDELKSLPIMRIASADAARLVVGSETSAEYSLTASALLTLPQEESSQLTFTIAIVLQRQSFTSRFVIR